MRENSGNEALPLAAAYRRRIGKVTFQVSSFCNSKTNQTAQQMVMSILEKKVTEEQGNWEGDQCA